MTGKWEADEDAKTLLDQDGKIEVRPVMSMVVICFSSVRQGVFFKLFPEGEIERNLCQIKFYRIFLYFLTHVLPCRQSNVTIIIYKTVYGCPLRKGLV